VKKAIVRTGVPLLVLLLILAAVLLYNSLTKKPATTLRATAIIDGVEVNLSPKVAGRISWICCGEGDTVKEGQVAVRLESSDISASVDQAAAGVERAKADIKAASAAVQSAGANRKSAEADMKSAGADVERALAQMEESRKEMQRAKELQKKDYISKESLDQAVAAYDMNAAAYGSSTEKKNSAEEKRNAAGAQLNAAVSQLNAAQAALKEAEANLAFYRTKLGDTVIKTPVSGTVIFKSMEAGETVSPGVTIMTIVDLNSIYARVDIDETKIGGIVLGSPASITVEGLPGRVFKGRISEIGRYAEFATQRDVVRGREDIKTFRVKIRVEDQEGLLKPGMTVEAEIQKKG
jgi:multidrug resistance efflux pump